MQEMKDYLLGTLEPGRRTQLEERIMCEPGVYEELLVVEEELIDQYVRGQLSKTEQQQFQTHFLITAERQQKLRFGKLLKRYLLSRPKLVEKNVPVAVRHAAPAPRVPLFLLAPFRKVPALAFSAVVVACLVFFGWFVTRRSAEAPVKHTASDLMVVTLAPGSTRSSGTIKRVKVPPRVDVQLDLELRNTSFHKYKSQLLRESEVVETRDQLEMEVKGDHHIVPLPIAGETLTPGDYQVRLSGVLDSGDDEFIDNYSFRVVAE
jgi:hypothetical protein